MTSCLHDTKTVSSVRVFFVAQHRKMYREPVNRSTNFVFQSKNFSIRFFSKPTRSDVLFTRYENGFVSSSVFRSAAQKNVLRTREPKHKICLQSKTSRYEFFQILLEVTMYVVKYKQSLSKSERDCCIETAKAVIFISNLNIQSFLISIFQAIKIFSSGCSETWVSAAAALDFFS